MNREGFRNRLKQYKKAREENPGLKYWEWKDIPKYDEGTDNVLDLPLGDIQIKPFKGFYSIFNNAANWLANKKKDEIFGDLPLKEIRNRLYKNMVPWSYADVEERLIETVKNNKPDPLYKQGISADERDDIFAEYLEIPQQLRKNSTYKVVQSNYKPTKNAGLDEYKTISNLIKVSGEKLIDDLHKKHISETLASGEHNSGNLTTKINEFEYLPINKNKVVNTFGNLFGPHTIGRGVDPQKGEYVSFYDDWDLAPFGGGKDESNGVGKPVKFYDRLYLDDFYGVSSKPKDEDYYGGYLPEVEVKPKKYKEGGEVTGPPTYEQWDTDTNQYIPTILDNASLYWSMEAAKKDIPKYDEGTGMVGTPSVGMVDFTNNLVSLLSEVSIKGLKNTIKRRLYDNLYPYNYSNWDLGESEQTRIINSVWKNKRDLLMLYRGDEYSNERDDIFAEYLEIPKENRHKIYNSLGVDVKHSVVPSKYKPSKTKNNNVEYKTIDKIKHKDIVESLDYSDNLNFNENTTVRNNLGKYFGYYTVGRGLDPKRGEYISVYDLWDINPFYGNSGSDSEDGNWLDKLIHKKVGNEDASFGIGKPIEFYDRVYLDDYYGVDSKPDKGQYYGGYIPEVKITPKKYDEGGKVIPTQEEYIAQQIAAEKAAALEKSLSRTMPRVPQGIKIGEQWNPVTKKVEDIYERGSSCAYTFADNYGLNWMSSEDFRQNHANYGWKLVPWEQRQPGNAVLIVDDSGTAKHTMMYDSDNVQGQPLFNHSNGGHDESAIRKKAKYPHHNPYLTYEFVGTPADSTQWINQYHLLYGK